jgi:hypothetical protein
MATPREDQKSAYRFEKRRVEALVTLVGGETTRGCFFLGSAHSHDGPERVAELLNDTDGFVPFELSLGSGDDHVVLYNRAMIVTVRLADNEGALEPGYDVAPRRELSILLSDGQRVRGSVRVYQPEGHYRLSDWTRQPQTFRYLETADATLIVNAAHIVAVTEV